MSTALQSLEWWEEGDFTEFMSEKTSLVMCFLKKTIVLFNLAIDIFWNYLLFKMRSLINQSLLNILECSHFLFPKERTS